MWHKAVRMEYPMRQVFLSMAVALSAGGVEYTDWFSADV